MFLSTQRSMLSISSTTYTFGRGEREGGKGGKKQGGVEEEKRKEVGNVRK